LRHRRVRRRGPVDGAATIRLSLAPGAGNIGDGDGRRFGPSQVRHSDPSSRSSGLPQRAGRSFQQPERRLWMENERDSWDGLSLVPGQRREPQLCVGEPGDSSLLSASTGLGRDRAWRSLRFRVRTLPDDTAPLLLPSATSMCCTGRTSAGPWPLSMSEFSQIAETRSRCGLGEPMIT
jgi:hypothetical protein